MKLVDKMKDENLGLAILYNFTKGYGHVPMSVYDVVLPFLYHDGFRNHLFEGIEVEEARSEEPLLNVFKRMLLLFKIY